MPKLNVMVVDMLEGFTRIGPLASPRVAKLIPAQADFLSALSQGSHVVFLQDAHNPDDLELKHIASHCLKGSEESQICKELKYAMWDGIIQTYILKRQFSGFYNTPIETLVGEKLFNNEWVVIGCVTDCCIEANVAELVYRGNKVTVLRDLVDTWDMDLSTAVKFGLPPAYTHDACILNKLWFEHRLPAIWGVTVTTSKQFLKERTSD